MTDTDDTTTPTPLSDFAAALNPPAGALSDALPFSLTAEQSSDKPREHQGDLFSENGDE